MYKTVFVSLAVGAAVPTSTTVYFLSSHYKNKMKEQEDNHQDKQKAQEQRITELQNEQKTKEQRITALQNREENPNGFTITEALDRFKIKEPTDWANFGQMSEKPVYGASCKRMATSSNNKKKTYFVCIDEAPAT